VFKQYHPNVMAVIQLLKLLQVKVSNGSVNETLQNHPDWPSLLCISDGLAQWNVPNGAGKIDPNEIDQVPVPFLIYLPGEEPPLGIVTDVGADNITLYNKSYKNIETVSRTSFLKRWNGVYLLTEPNGQSGEPDYRWKASKALLSSLLLFGIPVLLAVLAIFLTNRLHEYQAAAPAVLIQYFILLSGIFVTSLLLWYEIDSQNPLLQKVCSSIRQGSCNAILTSPGAKVFSWLSWSEVGFFYFTGGALSILFVKNALPVVAVANLIALPYVLYSVYYQWRVVKQWCILCMLVQILLVLGAVNILGGGLVGHLRHITVPAIISSCLFYMAPMYVWAVAKPLFLGMQKAKYMKREFLRIKFNTETFNALLHKEKKILASTEGMGIDLGDPFATNEIIKVCNPFCGACIRSHAKIEELLENTPNLKVKIIFRTSNNTDDPSVDLVKHFLAIAASDNEGKTKQALDSWYLSGKYNYDDFRKQFAVNGQLEKQTSRLEEMNMWCKKTDITFTPTFFINGRQLPEVYNINDLQYFLLE
jgi:uncharacterized membrane protein